MAGPPPIPPLMPVPLPAALPSTKPYVPGCETFSLTASPTWNSQPNSAA